MYRMGDLCLGHEKAIAFLVIQIQTAASQASCSMLLQGCKKWFCMLCILLCSDHQEVEPEAAQLHAHSHVCPLHLSCHSLCSLTHTLVTAVYCQHNLALWSCCHH